MRIAFIEIANFRKIKSTRIDFDAKQTLFVGSNNSGKTSAITALTMFLKDRGGFQVQDITLSNWRQLNTMAANWRSIPQKDDPDLQALVELLPAMDVWFDVNDTEIHRVADLLPNLDWDGGQIGVRLLWEPKKFNEMVSSFLKAHEAANELITEYKRAGNNGEIDFPLWPVDFKHYLEKRMGSEFHLKAYPLDPAALQSPTQRHQAQPQKLSEKVLPIDGDPLANLLHISVINAQRGFSDAQKRSRDDDQSNQDKVDGSKKLSAQLQSYYEKFVDPKETPSSEDISALQAIHEAEKTFNEKLSEGFADPIGELETLGYPGLSNPKLTILSRLKATDGLNHAGAVQYDLGSNSDGQNEPLHLPENYNGLGFQNLVYMVFNLIRFRSDWMKAGKNNTQRSRAELEAVQPLQLVLVEEPEAHLHAQVQQVFIRKAHEVLRNHPDLGEAGHFHTQLIVSTHSSHIAHEVPFSCLRYFKRIPADADIEVPNSVVANLTAVFGKNDDTSKFVARYIKTTHCDLFFADGVILFEGSAERMLVPHFISRGSPSRLSEHYISLMEIAGSHAHTLRPLIELLGIPTLIITDLDAGEEKQKNGQTRLHSVRPAIGKSQRTSNPTLRGWVPKLEQVDTLLSNACNQEVKGDGYGVVRVAYQFPIAVSYPDGSEKAIITPSTFEDALALTNIEVIKELKGTQLTKKLSDAVLSATSAITLADGFYNAVRTTSGKASFALDLLYSDQWEELKPPQYIAEGLAWLDAQMSSDIAPSPLSSPISIAEEQIKP